jgi:hypothetical protein
MEKMPEPVRSRPPETIPFVRVFYTTAYRRFIKGLCAAAFVVFIYATIASLRTDLQSPASIGTDASNYYAAGERLNEGHQLYALEAGDRPVANGIYASRWSYPLLSPPPIAVLWRPLAMIPGDISMYLWWCTGILASTAFAAWLILRSSAKVQLMALVLAPSLSITIWSGNLNALLIPLSAVLWWAGSRGKSNLAGFIVGLSALVKLMPGMYFLWFVFGSDRRSVRSFFLTVAAGLALSALGAGISAHFQYLDVAAQANSVDLSPFSPISMARSIGIGPPFAEWVPYAIAAVCAAGAWLARKRPEWCFAACSVGVALGTPDLRIETLAWLLVAMVPFAAKLQPSAAKAEKPAAMQLVAANAPVALPGAD